MGQIWIPYEGNEKFSQNFLLGNLKEKVSIGDLGFNGSVI
jgi:hypothetical protein